MARKKQTPGVTEYYQTLQRMFRLQSEILTGVLPHPGERGRNDEERFREFLIRVLPKKFSVGTGFLVCSDVSARTSSQTDVVIFDEVQNSPLHRELAAFVYPVEIVYGTVEVKGTLEKKDLRKICQDIRKVRELGNHRWYVEYASRPKAPDRPEQLVVTPIEQHVNVPPRAFVFAYEKKGWRTLEDLVKSLEEVVRETPAHIHGLAILGKDWYVSQEAYADGGVRFQASEGNALLKFVNGMIHSIASVPMKQMSIDRYFDGK